MLDEHKSSVWVISCPPCAESAIVFSTFFFKLTFFIYGIRSGSRLINDILSAISVKDTDISARLSFCDEKSSIEVMGVDNFEIALL